MEILPPTQEIPPSAWSEARSWLEAFGYVAPNVELTARDIASAPKPAQAFGNMPIIGEYDEATRKLFVGERCGNRDVDAPVAGPPGPPTRTDCRDIIRASFYAWSAVAPFTFTEDASGGPVDILIRWG
ncbi:hypothetical protein B0T25DRAFT_571207 [Lasiosphaeria hispida]|uniref:Uncharacterized protein n=1 Tax=Lasiosphaeria hispida TaxID=260671 RepID=A0AAJ0HAJ4_9PEZI|nr:hypothetical protein B0T25DRAFT_571207 [Lasiosphaeria hispida]